MLEPIFQHCAGIVPGILTVEIFNRMFQKDPNSRIVPAGLTVETLFDFLGSAGLPLHYPLGKELWRANTQMERIPTEEEVIGVDFDNVMRPTDLHGAPFNIESFDGFKDWAKTQGGVLPSVELTLYLMARSVIEHNRPLWSCGSVMCQNATDHSKTGVYLVNWYPYWGLSLIPWGKIGQRWGMGTIAIKHYGLDDLKEATHEED